MGVHKSMGNLLVKGVGETLEDARANLEDRLGKLFAKLDKINIKLEHIKIQAGDKRGIQEVSGKI